MTERKSARTPLEALNQLVEALGSQSAAAKHIGVGRQYMSDLLSGRRGISGTVAKALGFKKRVVFEPIERR
jgi:plasmid maintenance system antidote protein VapI